MSAYNPNQPTPPTYQGGQYASVEPAINQPYYGISFPDAIKRYFVKYVTFSGRASKSEFWWSYLFLVIVNAVFSVLSSATNRNGFIGLLSTLWSLATIVPSLSIAFRRLHDANKSGGLIFIPIGLVVLGFVIVLIGGGSALISGLSYASSGAAGASAALAGSVGAIVFGGIVLIAGAVVAIVFMCFATDPAGARFDANAQVPAQPVAPLQQNAWPQQGVPVQQPGAQYPPYAQPQQPIQQQPQQPAWPQPQQPTQQGIPQQGIPQQPQQPYDPSQQIPPLPQQDQ